MRKQIPRKLKGGLYVPEFIGAPKRIVNLVGEIYLDVEVCQDCDGETEVRNIESMTFLIRNKKGSISGDLLKFRNFHGETPADRIDMTVLHAVIERENEKEEAEHQRDLAEDRARKIWEDRN